MIHFILATAMLGFVAWVYIHDKREEQDNDALYEEWKEKHHVKNL